MVSFLAISFIFSSYNLFCRCSNRQEGTKSMTKIVDKNCKYNLEFDKSVVKSSNIIKNKVIEEAYLRIKKGLNEIHQKALNFFDDLPNFFISSSEYDQVFLITEHDSNLKFTPLTKSLLIGANQVFFYGQFTCGHLDFMIFNDINKAIALNRNFGIGNYPDFESYINKLLT